jgi:hypothetical protein
MDQSRLLGTVAAYLDPAFREHIDAQRTFAATNVAHVLAAIEGRVLILVYQPGDGFVPKMRMEDLEPDARPGAGGRPDVMGAGRPNIEEIPGPRGGTLHVLVLSCGCFTTRRLRAGQTPPREVPCIACYVRELGSTERRAP